MTAAAGSQALRIRELEDTLIEEAGRSQGHAARLESLSRLANERLPGDADVTLAMLAHGAAGLRAGRWFCGTVSHLDGAELVVDARVNDERADQPGARRAPLGGRRYPLATAVESIVRRTGRTSAWNDLHEDPRTASLAPARRSGARSLVSTPFDVAGTTYFLTYWSPAPATTPFRHEDRSYVELLASMLATRLRLQGQTANLEHQRDRDALTGLPNRARFIGELHRTWAAPGLCAVAVVDIDFFRAVNETYGSNAGDAVLVSVAARLAARLAEGELVARLAGDAFALFFPGVTSRRKLDARIAELLAVFAAPFSVFGRGDEHIEVTASVGIALGSAGESDPEVLVTRADTALHAAKGGIRGRRVFFEPGMERETERRTRLAMELRRALNCGELVLHYQPHLDLATDRVCAAEALVRWNHPARGLLAPAEFIPFAEETGIIASIDAWVMRESEAAIAVLRQASPGFRLYFNISAQRLEEGSVVEHIAQAQARGARLANLGVEITETGAMRDVAATRRTIAALKAVGMKVALDDFGTGYSSLAALKRLPLDVVKIDRSFVSGVLSDERDAAIAEAVLSIADRFGFAVVAEGVERVAELQWFKHRACGSAQGHLISKPLPLSEFIAWLAERTPASFRAGARTQHAAL